MMAITRTEYSVADLVSWRRREALILNPEFQRRSVWRPGARSFFIDTIVRRYPVPVLFMRDLPPNIHTGESSREVVDGQQRLRTVFAFIDQELLPDFKTNEDGFSVLKSHNPAIAGKPFVRLSEDYRKAILEYKFGVHTFSSDTSDREVLQIFARMNATGVRLNSQELRNAEYYGDFKTIAYQLGGDYLDFWRDWGIFTSHAIARMKEAELTSELIIMMQSGVQALSQPLLNKTYKDNDTEMDCMSKIERRFRSVMDTISIMDSSAIDVFNTKTMFYALFVAIYNIKYGTNPSLDINTKPGVVSDDAISKMIAAGSRVHNKRAKSIVLQSVSSRPTNVSSRRILINYFMEAVGA